jgi:hypothetical protein
MREHCSDRDFSMGMRLRRKLEGAAHKIDIRARRSAALGAHEGLVENCEPLKSRESSAQSWHIPSAIRIYIFILTVQSSGARDAFAVHRPA